MANIIALDYGEKRVGVAIADTEVKFASPLVTLQNDTNLPTAISGLIREKEAEKVVLGLPRNLAGEETPQTRIVRKFAEKLKNSIEIPIYLMDEAATSVQAESELKQSKKNYQPGDIDALAAAIILEDFLANYA